MELEQMLQCEMVGECEHCVCLVCVVLGGSVAEGLNAIDEKDQDQRRHTNLSMSWT